MSRLYGYLAGALLVVACIAGLYAWGRNDGRQAAERELAAYKAEAVAKNSELAEKARKAESDKAQVRNEVAAAYERGKQDAQATGGAVAADLRAGNLRLRKQWAGCVSAASGAGTGTGEPDAGADLRAADAGDLVRVAAACDAHVKGLQGVIEADRK